MDQQESQAIDWKQVVAHLARVTDEPQRCPLKIKAFYAPPFYRWDEEDD